MQKNAKKLTCSNKEFCQEYNEDIQNLFECPCGVRFSFKSRISHNKCKRHMILLKVIGVIENDEEYLKIENII